MDRIEMLEISNKILKIIFNKNPCSSVCSVDNKNFCDFCDFRVTLFLWVAYGKKSWRKSLRKIFGLWPEILRIHGTTELRNHGTTEVDTSTGGLKAQWFP